jgi:protein-S-isoprenylcysteine O-methyltransferase Ste14
VTELVWHGWAVRAEFALAAITVIALLFVVAPYGRYARDGWGPTLPPVLGWVLMELPAVVLFAGFFFAGDHRFELVPLVLLGLWQLHYVNRTFVFPLRMRASGRRMPLLITVLGIGFNTLNAYTNARWIGHLGSYEVAWLTDPRFLAGATVFLAGWLGNLHSDAILRNLRKPGETGYTIPRGGLYRWISAPNYLCEILEWTGWAVATWSTAGLAFAVYTAANLGPRALSHHVWYREQFANYPPERKALLPYLL